jgi:flagellar biosynthesis protein FlhG
MNDQAERLREIISKIKSQRNESLTGTSRMKGEHRARVITITSGKGGVGKTNITVNLAISLSNMGKKVAIIDADIGLANIDVLLGIIPRFTLLDVINNSRSIIEALAVGPGNIRFISGGSGVSELIELEEEAIQIFLDNITLLDKMFDIILIDTGAGLSRTVLGFVLAADDIILVTTPEPTSITDAYALIKMVARKEKNKRIRVIVNKAESAKEAEDIQNKLKLVSDRFLGMKLIPAGYIVADENVRKAVMSQRPFIINYPNSRASRQIREITKKLLENKDGKEVLSSGFRGFVKKFLNSEALANKTAEK